VDLRNKVQKIRRGVELLSVETIDLEGGRLEMRVSRSRTKKPAQGASGLKFRVELQHNVKPVLLVDLKVMFRLGGMAMGPDAPIQASESETISMPLFADKTEVMEHLVGSDKLMDGRAEVTVYPQRNIIPITEPEAKKHIVEVIAGTKEANELESVWVAAAINGDRDLLHLMLSRYLLERDQAQKLALLKGFLAAEENGPAYLLRELRVGDRSLEYTKIIAGGELMETSLPPDVRPVAWKRSIVDLLALLPGGISGKGGKFGQELFDLYRERPDLQDRIRSAYMARPRESVTSLLGLATKVDLADASGGGRAKAEAAAKLLISLGAPILRALYDEIKREGLDPSELETLQDKSGDAQATIRKGVELLILHYLKKQEEEFDRTVREAAEKANEGDFESALGKIRWVLRRKKDHRGAVELLPQVLVSKGGHHRAKGQRGPAAVAFEEALEHLAPGERAKAAQPLGELLVQAADEDVDHVTLRSAPHPGAGLIRKAKPAESFPGEEAKARGWLKVTLDDKTGYVLKAAMRFVPPNKYTVDAPAIPYTDVQEMLERARTLAPSLEAKVNEVSGRLAAREGEAKYNQGAYQEALAHFEVASKYAPTDPRLDLKMQCWIKANTGPLVAVAGVIAFAVGVALLQAFSRPKKVAFKGEFKHYGAERTSRERDLEAPGDSAGDVGDL
jgi:tetratricopeptide (TPR) repeat protein